MCGSTCFGRLHVHHQELTTVLAASGLPSELGDSSVVGRGLTTTTNNAATTSAPTVKPEAADAVVELLMMDVEAPETC